MKCCTMKANIRKKVGKGSANQLRNKKQIPAIIYGENNSPIPIYIDYNDIFCKIYNNGFRTTIFSIEILEKKINVIPKDLQIHPVKDIPLHIDFLRVSEITILKINVPIHFINTDICIGIKKGGILNIIKHEIEVLSQVKNIPSCFEVDIAKYEIGDSIYLSSIKLNNDIKFVCKDKDLTIATIVATKVILKEDDKNNTKK